uniref:Uncharacterized protein n=1 Tax=Kalanchoe fedtschenkoi TaxID=63787 RepID=A0A7N0UUT2_KALFE
MCCKKAAEFASNGCKLCICCPLSFAWCCIKMPAKISWRVVQIAAQKTCFRSKRRPFAAIYSTFSDSTDDCSDTLPPKSYAPCTAVALLRRRSKELKLKFVDWFCKFPINLPTFFFRLSSHISSKK